MQNPKLNISDTARNALKTLISQCGLDNPVATVFRARDAQGQELGWMGGAYSRERLSKESILHLENVDLYIEEDRWPEFDGKTLNFRDGKFWVDGNNQPD